MSEHTNSSKTSVMDQISPVPSPYVINPTSPSPELREVFTQFRDSELKAYLDRTPFAPAVIQQLLSAGGSIVNDHVALRCFRDASGTGGRDLIGGIFEAFGYKAEDLILIEGLLLECRWYEPPESSNWPKVFISEQQVDRLPEEAQNIVYNCIGDYYTNGPLKELDLDCPEKISPMYLFHLLEDPPWNPSSGQYEQLLGLVEKFPEFKGALQYTAWTLIHAHRWNHFTILLNNLGIPKFQCLEDLNAYLKENGFPLNDFNGREIQGSEERRLKQSSTLSSSVSHTFSDGVSREVSGSFVEFIERFSDDSGPFRGFLADNARGIFASTDVLSKA